MNKLPILLDEEELSEWAYRYCKHIKDDPEIRKCIKVSYWAFLYCYDINNDPEIKKNITNSIHYKIYCENVV